MKLRNLDILRACLALMVLIGHARSLLWMPWHEWNMLPHPIYEKILAAACGAFRFGGEAVTVFFVLSGFFIHLRAASQLTETSKQLGFSAHNYIRRRALRILPPYFAALVFTVLADMIGRYFFPGLYSAATGDTWIDASAARSGYTLTSIVPALLAQPRLFGMHFGSNGPLWSICYEVFYYAVYPLFMLLWVRGRLLAYGTGLCLSLLCWCWPLAGWWSPMMSSYPIWLAGALLAENLVARPFATGYRSLWITSTLSLVTLLVIASPWGKSHLFATLLLGMLLGTSTIAAFLSLPPRFTQTHLGLALEWIGIRSYSIYIFHYPVLILLAAAIFHGMGSRPPHGWLALGGSILTLIAGLIGFWLVEARFLSRREGLDGPSK